MNVTMSLTDHSIISGAAGEQVDQIHSLVSASLTIQATGGTLTADGSEQNIYYDNEPLGVMSPIALLIDLDNMQGGDTIEIKVYHRLSEAGTLKLFAFYTWTGADGGLDNSEKIDQIDLYPNRHGFRITLDQTGGTNRDYPWELFIGI